MRLTAAAARGLVARAVGTGAMDLVWVARYPRGGGESGFRARGGAGGIERWEDAPAPAQVARRLIRAVTHEDPPVERAPALTNVMHWAYGTAWSAQYAVLTSVLRRRPWWRGLAFGGAVWGSDYVVLPV